MMPVPIALPVIVLNLALGVLSPTSDPPPALSRSEESVPVPSPRSPAFLIALAGPTAAPALAQGTLPGPEIKRHPLTAAAEVAGLNFGVWAFLQYVANAYYSYISTETMLDNFRDGWEWDRSRYYVNFYHHPYHGYLYYNAGRANGLDYWGSSLCTLGGSFMWEMMMEKYRPSVNDLITTTCGGVVYGEIGYRFSALVRKSDSHGLGRIWREALGAIFNPVGAANRLLDGRKDSYPGLPGSPDAGRILNGELLLTGPVIVRSAELTGTRAAPLVGFTLHYGDAAGAGWTGRPFDVFNVEGRLRWGPDRPHLSLFIWGALAGRSWARTAEPTGSSPSLSGPSHFFGLYQHYEYYGFETMRVAGTSFTGGWTSRLVLKAGARLTTSARLGWLALGASDDFLTEPGEREAYNMATGITAAADLAFAVKGFDYLTVRWHHYNLFDLDVRGSRLGREAWDILQAQVEVPLWSTFGLGFETEYCSRRFNFRAFPSGHRNLGEIRAFVAWQF